MGQCNKGLTCAMTENRYIEVNIETKMRKKFRYMNVLGYLEEILLFIKDLLYNSSLLSLLGLCSMVTYHVHYVYLDLLFYLQHLLMNTIKTLSHAF